VLTAIDAGVNTPTEIRTRVHSPANVVLQVLMELADEGAVEPTEPVEDRLERPYRRVNPTDVGVEDTAEGVETGEHA